PLGSVKRRENASYLRMRSLTENVKERRQRMNDILITVGADISDFSRKMAESNQALQNFGNANKQTFDSFKKVGAVATATGTAIGVGLGKAVKTAADFEAGMSEVAAISGVS